MTNVFDHKRDVRVRSLLVVVLALLLSLGVAGGAAARTVSGPEGKLDSHIQRLVAGQERNTNVEASGRDSGLTVDGGERVLVDIYVSGLAGPAADQLRAAGMDVRAMTNKAPVTTVEGWLPVALADSVAKLAAVRAVVPVMGSGTNSGAILSQGDAAHHGPEARQQLPGPLPPPTGAGVRVGVISDSMDRAGSGLEGSFSSGDLPRHGVRILKEGPTGSSDEGRAMAEIIYDEAPGLSDFLFASGTGSGPVGKANSIDQLTFSGANVVADDIFYLGEPFFQDGVVSQAVDNAAAHGVAYFVSAGNRARQSYEQTFRNSTLDPGFHQFSTSPGTTGQDTTQTVVTVPNGRFIEIVLQWDEPWGRASTDLDLFLVNAGGSGNQLASDVTGNISTGIPSASVFWRNNTGGPVSVGVRIQRFAGARTPYMKYIARGDFGTFSIGEWDTASNTIDPDAAAAKGAIAVAAVDVNDPGLDTPEPFSSHGAPFRFFDKSGNTLPGGVEFRQAPALAATDNVSTSVPGFNRFGGTSAAAPSAAGIAALVKSARPSMSAGELIFTMLNPANSVQCAPGGSRPDRECGMGFIYADRAVRQALTPGITAVSPTSGATNVLPNGNLVVQFNEAMNHTQTQRAFSLERTSDEALVEGTFIWFGNALVFDPSSDLQNGVNYTATVNKAAYSPSFINLPATKTWSFTTTNRPAIVSQTPAPNATGVGRGTKVVVGFSKAMNKAATQAAFSLKRASNGATVAGSTVWFGNGLVFTPSTAMAASTRYTVAVGSGARDTAGNTLINPASWGFTTGP